MYLVIANATKVRHLLNTWVRPGKKHRRLEEGVIRRLRAGVFALENLRLALYLKMVHRDDVRIFDAEELSYDDLVRRYEEGKRENVTPRS